MKMLFAEPANEKLLLSRLEAVLRPSWPIARVRVVDGELPKNLVSDRGLRLDVLVELADGRVVDVEMKVDASDGRPTPGACTTGLSSS